MGRPPTNLKAQTRMLKAQAERSLSAKRRRTVRVIIDYDADVERAQRAECGRLGVPFESVTNWILRLILRQPERLAEILEQWQSTPTKTGSWLVLMLGHNAIGSAPRVVETCRSRQAIIAPQRYR
jgi:hypothetical protein